MCVPMCLLALKSAVDGSFASGATLCVFRDRCAAMRTTEDNLQGLTRHDGKLLKKTKGDKEKGDACDAER